MKFKIVKLFFIVICILVFCTLAVTVGLAVYVNKNIDFKADEALFSDAASERVIRLYYDAAGKCEIEDYTPMLYEEIRLSSINRCWYSYEDFSTYLIGGFIAMEDRGFYAHHGVDLKRTLAATLNYAVKGKKNFGGSTITQQVIKNISGNRDKTMKRKLDEIIRAYHIEYSHSKEEIFELYLNIIPMSGNLTGAGTAAKEFFGKEPSELSAAEAATLIAIANAPSRYDPYRNPKECKKKRDVVLSVMYSEGVIDDAEYSIAISTPLATLEEKVRSLSVRSWFSEAVIEDIVGDLMKKYEYSHEAARLYLYKNGASVYTTVDPDAQRTIEDYFADESNFPEECARGLEYAMVVTDAKENLLRAIVGSVGKKTANNKYNYASVPIVPGSALKPIALYLPLINEQKITCASVFDDVPVTFYKNSSGEYVEYPKNSPQRYDGLITVSDALRLSKNTVAVRLYNILGAEKIYKYLKENFGFDTLVRSEKGKNGVITDLATSPLALGQLSRGVSLRRLTEAYNVFSGEGRLRKGRSYIAVFDSDGEIVLSNEKSEKQVADAASARVMTQFLKDVVESGTGSKITLKDIYDTAGKTGTSGNDRDRVFIGYTPYYIAGIWCGYTDRSESVRNHERNHLTVWDDVMRLIHEKTLSYSESCENFSVQDLIYASFCKDSGKRFSEACSYDVRGDRIGWGYFMKGTEPGECCDRHVVLYENIFPFITKISLIRIEERAFPKEINVTDEKYVYRDKKTRQR